MSKIILITGVSSGMSKEAAKALIKQGHTVYAAARRINQILDLKLLGGYPIQMDVTNDSEIESTVNKSILKESKIDVLWNNVGFGLYKSVEDVSVEETRRQFKVNLFGMAAVTQKVVPHNTQTNYLKSYYAL